MRVDEGTTNPPLETEGADSTPGDTIENPPMDDTSQSTSGPSGDEEAIENPPMDDKREPSAGGYAAPENPNP